MPRPIAERWVDNAFSRGRDEAYAEFMGTIEALAPGSIAAGKNHRIPEPSPEKRAYFAKLDAAGAMMSDPALAKYDTDTRARIAHAAVFGEDRNAGVMATPEGIVRAGRMRRAEIPTPAAAFRALSFLKRTDTPNKKFYVQHWVAECETSSAKAGGCT